MAPVDCASMLFLLSLVLSWVAGTRNRARRLKEKRTVRCICVLCCFDRNLEYHLNFEVWNSFLIMSCLSLFLTRVEAHTNQSLLEMHTVLSSIDRKIANSTASLYTPHTDVKDCTHRTMYCFLLELEVLLNEENSSKDLTMILHLKREYENVKCSECNSACEQYQQTNRTTFLKEMLEFLQKLMSQTLSESDCDQR